MSAYTLECDEEELWEIAEEYASDSQVLYLRIAVSGGKMLIAESSQNIISLWDDEPLEKWLAWAAGRAGEAKRHPRKYHLVTNKLTKRLSQGGARGPRTHTRRNGIRT